ncbi:phenolic glucoside malonyltransferase 1-like [Arachis duranensis]|uniref:Phenolic glucoside malonyltransferase 1-like n=1 Tax=Arachis duranensis TaxID=130453 RepID=A0A9C6WSZ4_ARADU|nr:phenolic glucoside malonyltransferase 1-like [Arachis duranensis]
MVFLKQLLLLGAKLENCNLNLINVLEHLCQLSFSKWSHRMLGIAGSPKLDVYETDFGWGKPKLSEVVQLDPQLMSLSDCRDKEDGIIEVGVALGRTQIHKFNTILEELLANIAVCD